MSQDSWWLVEGNSWNPIALLRGEFSPLPLAPVFAGAISLELHGVPSSAAIAAAIIWIR